MLIHKCPCPLAQLAEGWAEVGICVILAHGKPVKARVHLCIHTPTLSTLGAATAAWSGHPQGGSGSIVTQKLPEPVP